MYVCQLFTILMSRDMSWYPYAKRHIHLCYILMLWYSYVKFISWILLETLNWGLWIWPKARKTMQSAQAWDKLETRTYRQKATQFIKWHRTKRHPKMPPQHCLSNEGRRGPPARLGSPCFPALGHSALFLLLSPVSCSWELQPPKHLSLHLYFCHKQVCVYRFISFSFGLFAN